MHDDLWHSFKLYEPYEYIPISHVIHSSSYGIHTHAFLFGLNMYIEII